MRRNWFEFIPLLYAPFGFYLSAALLHVLGLGSGFLAGRLVSILATLATLVLICRLVAAMDLGLGQEGGATARRPVFSPERVLPGIVASGIYIAAYRFTGAWRTWLRSLRSFCFSSWLAMGPALGFEEGGVG